MQKYNEEIRRQMEKRKEQRALREEEDASQVVESYDDHEVIKSKLLEARRYRDDLNKQIQEKEERRQRAREMEAKEELFEINAPMQHVISILFRLSG